MIISYSRRGAHINTIIPATAAIKSYRDSQTVQRTSICMEREKLVRKQGDTTVWDIFSHLFFFIAVSHQFGSDWNKPTTAGRITMTFCKDIYGLQSPAGFGDALTFSFLCGLSLYLTQTVMITRRCNNHWWPQWCQVNFFLIRCYLPTYLLTYLPNSQWLADRSQVPLWACHLRVRSWNRCRHVTASCVKTTAPWGRAAQRQVARRRSNMYTLCTSSCLWFNVPLTLLSCSFSLINS